MIPKMLCSCNAIEGQHTGAECCREFERIGGHTLPTNTLPDQQVLAGALPVLADQADILAELLTGCCMRPHEYPARQGGHSCP